MSLLSRKLDNKAFEKYAHKKYDADDDAVLPDADAFQCWDADVSDLIITGFDDDAKELLRAANAGDAEVKDTPELVVQWCTMDRVYYIVRRVEEKIRVPKAYWYLAAEGRLLTPETVACNSTAFNGVTPELVLVPKAALGAFKQSLQPKSQGAMQKVAALFGLVEPLGSTDAKAWTAYLKQRKLCNTRLQQTLAEMDDESEPCRAMFKQIRRGTADVAGDSVNLENTITPWSVSIEDDDGDVRSSDILTRIHSLTKPAAVDVKIWYWHKARYYSVEWGYTVEYRIANTVSENPPNKKGGAWKKLVSMRLEDSNSSGKINKWNPREVKNFGMTGADVRAVRSVLFGDSQDAGISMVDTVRLLLASVGICIKLRVADASKKMTENGSDEDDEDRTNRDKFDSHGCTTKYGSLADPRWLGVHIRRVCSAAIPSDADFVDRAAEPRYEEDEFEEDQDDYDDDYF